ncbi:MAG: R3H domain-containing nucleic acid-binding protein [Chloroflexota bacterium]
MATDSMPPVQPPIQPADPNPGGERIAPAHRMITDDLEALLATLPPGIGESMRALPQMSSLIEVVMDLGRRPEARFSGGGEEFLLDREIDGDDLQYVVDHIGSFGDDNRAGIERTLHRISAIRNRSGKIVGVTCRVGRAVFGTIDILVDLVESGQSILIMGRPGIGKTTMLREAARVLADDLDKRVVIVDTSNEIAGDGDIPHPGIGRARRMQVRTPELQHAVMIEAVENHMPEVIVIDEIGTELEAVAARTIAERGVQLIGTAHGNDLDNLMLNPTLSDLIGGIQTVTLGDDEARRRRSQKSVLERKAPPTFDVVVEIQDRDRVAVHTDVAETIDALLRGDALAPEMRWRDEGGVHRSQARPRPGPRTRIPGERFGGLVGQGVPEWRSRGQAFDGHRGSADRGRSGGPARTLRGRGGARQHADSGAGWPGTGSAAEGSRGASVFRAGDIADRGPLERGSPALEPRARDSREFERQAEWRASANRALDEVLPSLAGPDEHDDGGTTNGAALSASVEEEGSLIRLSESQVGMVPLETINVLGYGVSRKRLEQAIKDLQLPVVVVREPDESDVVITLRNTYKQKSPIIREAEARGIPIYVLKSNTVAQMQACLTSLFVLDTDPQDAALHEVEEAIGLVRSESKPVELSPQNAFVRRLQHKAAEAASLASRSRGREPFRRVRVYPAKGRARGR